MFTTMRVLSGDRPGPPLEDLIRDVEAPTLLISAGKDVEREFNVLHDDAAGESVEHWNLPDAQHTRAPPRVRAARRRVPQRGAALSTPASASFSRR
jgi:hypothetical protein